MAMSHLTYCEKCGDIGSSLFWNAQENGCFSCRAKETIKAIPKEYLSATGNTIKENLEEEFIEKFVKSSPNFDQACWDRRVAFKEVQKHNKELLEYGKQCKANIPKCPTCGSTSIKKISLTKKVFGGAMFGLFSSDVRNTMHCENCGAKW